MRNTFPSLLALCIFFSCSTSELRGEKKEEATTEQKKSATQPAPPAVVTKMDPFTGKITKNKIRLRLQPHYEGPILRELNRNDYVVVLGETEDFYSIQPPADIKGYVFRSYVLDNIVEGDRVNIRLEPNREATIVGQLKAGDHVDGNIAAANNKWLEITLPNTIRFYIAKEYVENVGDAGLKERLDKKRIAAYDLLNTTNEMSQIELQKPFDQMSIAGIKANYQHIINDYSEFPEATVKAREALAAIQEVYTAKKIAYLEEKSRFSTSTLEANKKLNAELEAQKSKITHLENQIEQNRQFVTVVQPITEVFANTKKPNQLPINMSVWLPIEENLFNEWAQRTGRHNPQEFYDDQKQHGFILRGVIDSYTRPIKNKPGDYMLLNTASKLPIAFLYSTHINLQNYIGHEVSLIVSPRNNHNFAFPAYFVLTLD